VGIDNPKQIQTNKQNRINAPFLCVKFWQVLPIRKGILKATDNWQTF
jgi:hypothetical protein